MFIFVAADMNTGCIDEDSVKICKTRGDAEIKKIEYMKDMGIDPNILDNKGCRTGEFDYDLTIVEVELES